MDAGVEIDALLLGLGLPLFDVEPLTLSFVGCGPPLGFAAGLVSFATGPVGCLLVGSLQSLLEPRTGGLIIADGEPSAIEAAVASDPFITQGAATADILRFEPTWTQAADAPGTP